MKIAPMFWLDDTTGVGASPHGRTPGWRTGLLRVTKAHILFPALTVRILSVIWSATFKLIRVERAGAETAAASASLELVNTYEAQIVRALREIDQTLKLVKYIYETKDAGTLSGLKAKTLLPPELVFAIRVEGRDGAIIATTRPGEAPAGDAQQYLAVLRNSNKLWVGAPHKVAAQEWVLQFGRRLNAVDGTFAGAVLLSVDPAFFVSGYDAAQLGREGMLGIIGTDGIVRARRTGDRFSAGEAVDYASLVPGTDQGDPTVSLSDNSADGVRRYTGTQQLFDFPLAVVVGLSADEQLATAHRNIRSYLWRASVGSALLIIFTTLLGRMGWQLARGRERENDAKMQYAQRVEYLESSLRHALERGEFQLHYQPKRDVAHGHITGMEALVRWQHPDLGVVAPMQFIPIAEETGLIVAIGKWVLQTACRQNVAWQREGLPQLTIAVNLAARQFCDEQLMHDIGSILKSTGMEARLLEIEVHEGVLFQDIARTLRILGALKAMGINIAIDDFGMGYSSLAKLQQFPLDTIKIDRSFIRGLAPGADGNRLTEGIIAMGRSLSLNIVAQGVETKEQAEFLREHACDEFQGFYFNKPMSAEHVTEILRAQMTGDQYQTPGHELAT